MLSKNERKRIREEARRLYLSELSDKQSGRCVYCGIVPDIKTIDHIIPLISGGTNDKKNLVMACDKCNSRKSDYPLEICIFPKQKRLKGRIRKYKNNGERIPSSKNLLRWCDEEDIPLGKLAIHIIRRREIGNIKEVQEKRIAFAKARRKI